MSRIGYSAAILAAGLLVSAGAALAQMPGWAAGPYYYGHHGHGMGPMFGVIDHYEYLDAAQQRFTAADTDKDGKISPWDYRRHFHRHRN